MAGVSQRIVMGLRSTLFAKLQKLPVAFFDLHTHGEIMSRLANDIENVSATISQSTTQLMAGAITITGSLVMMLVLSPMLTLASIITVPLVFLLTRTIAKFHIQQAMLKLMSGRTSFIIAHRLSTIRDADTIMVIDGGRIVEKGNHESLIKGGGAYRDLYMSQFKNAAVDNIMV